ncbi:MAG: tetratricopeptide repeat protein, partial [Planctomycetota bacterium]
RGEAAADVSRDFLSIPVEGSVPTELAALRGQAELGLGYIRREAEQLDAAEEHFRTALGWMARATSDPTQVADAWIALASCFTLTGRFDESLEALETARSTAGPEAHALFHARLESTIGNLHGSQGSYEEALMAFERALERREAVVDEDHPSLVLALANVAGMLGATGDLAGAEERLTRAVALHRASPGDPSAYARALQNLGNCRYVTGRVEAAIEPWREALDIWIGLAGQDSRAAASLYFSLAEGYHALGDEALSEEMAELGRMAGATDEE